ncbi:MAG: hypothetical protein ACERKV_10860 [Clostridiaceae bacterium]
MGKSVIIELQEDAMRMDNSISALIRKAYVIARKLKLKEFSDWLQYELNGYSNFEEGEWPEYRVIVGELKGWNPYYGWVPVIIQEESISNLICKQKIINSISNLEDMLESGSKDVLIQLNAGTSNLISKSVEYDTKFGIFINKASISEICDMVKNIVLEWSLKLEEEGIEGEGLTFTKHEEDRASEIVTTINNYFGNVSKSQIQQNTSDSTQVLSIGYSKENVENILKELKVNYKNINLPIDKAEDLRVHINQLEETIITDTNNNLRIKKTLNSIKNILEGATGSLIASGLLYLIGQVLAK